MVLREHDGLCDAGGDFDEAGGDEFDTDVEGWAGDAQFEVAGHGHLVGGGRVFQVSHAGRIDACPHQPVVEIAGGLAPQSATDFVMQRSTDLEEDEDVSD